VPRPAGHPQDQPKTLENLDFQRSIFYTGATFSISETYPAESVVDEVAGKREVT